MSDYKDDYILSGRTKLFFDYLLRTMGDGKFSEFGHELFNREDLDEKHFVDLCEKHLPENTEEIHGWLYTNNYSDNFKIEKVMN